jgi:hypothetical protein
MPIKCISIFRAVLRVKTDSYSKQHYLAGLVMKTHCVSCDVATFCLHDKDFVYVCELQTWRSEVLTALKIQSLLSYAHRVLSLRTCRRFGGTYCLHLWRKRLHGVITQ